MIDSGYSYYKIGVKKINRDGHLNEHKYKFKNRKGHVYIIQVDEYLHDIFFVKFYLGIHKTHPNKYKYLTKTNDAFRVIRTSINTLLELKDKNSNASFGFMGSPSVNKKGDGKEESLINTQRFRIYEYVTNNYFGNLSFTHSLDKNYSCYLLINNCNPDVKEYIARITEMFKSIYPSLDALN